MLLDYLHNHKEYKDLIRAVADEMRIVPDLVEKDYWIMHCLYGLKKQGYQFELKGGTSLSKGFGIIHRFSEDIDIRIEPSESARVFIGKNHNKLKHINSRKAFYNQLAEEIKIDGITEIVRDVVFDDEKYRSGGIRLLYSTVNTISDGVKEGILLEVGFDNVTPNRKVDISSWALEFAQRYLMQVTDNTARQITCYEPGYTFVEKLQTIATKFRYQQTIGTMPKNFMRHYYDIACLLDDESVQAFIGTEKYEKHKEKRFPTADYIIPISKNEAFILSDKTIRQSYVESYKSTAALYYKGQPDFESLLDKIQSTLQGM